MIRIVRIPLIISAIILILMSVGCEFKFKAFTVTGIWEVHQTSTRDDGKKEIWTYHYEFMGNEFNGTVATTPRLSAGLYCGTYQVEGNQIVFRYSMGRGNYASSTLYTGEISPSIEGMKGTLTGAAYIGGEIITTWTGDFVAEKIMEDREEKPGISLSQ